MNKRTTFVGHRNIDTNIKDRLKKAIINEYNKGCKIFTMGNYGNFNKTALAVCRELRQIYNDIKIEVFITSINTPNTNNGNRFKQYSDVSCVFYQIEDVYYKKQITISNQQMINNSDTLICYVNPNQSYSVSKTTMDYAKKQNLNVINIYQEEDYKTYETIKKERIIFL